MRIAAWIPDSVIHAVQDAGQGVLAMIEKTLQPVTESRGADLLRVGRADRGEPVGVYQAALDERELIMKFQRLH